MDDFVVQKVFGPVTFNESILRLTMRGGGQDADFFAEQQLTGLPTDELGVEVTQHTADRGVAKVLAHVSEQLEQGVCDGGPRQIAEAITPAHAGA